ncbi:MAG: acylphosphatase [Candidatus Aminicenantia bacterium]
MKARVHIYVSGRVQGVFFRDHTRTWAKSLDLTGWVMNLSDGRVEVIAEGEKENIEKLIKKLKEGPPSARVDEVDVKREEYRGEFGDFQIRWGW